MSTVDDLKQRIKATDYLVDGHDGKLSFTSAFNQLAIMHALVELLERKTGIGLCIHCGEKTEGLVCLQCAPTRTAKSLSVSAPPPELTGGDPLGDPYKGHVGPIKPEDRLP